MPSLLSKVYDYDFIKDLKDKVRPFKNRVFGYNDFYRACYEISSANDRFSIKTILDVGAASGDMTRYLLKEYPNAYVYAFEPNIDQFKRLESKTLKMLSELNYLILDFQMKIKYQI